MSMEASTARDEYRGGVDRERDRGERDREQMKTRSLRKPTTTSGKLRISGDIDYEQDSEQDFQQRERASVRSLQRPSQLGADVVLPIGGGGGGGVGGSQRLRKSSGSSPWDGEEPALPGQKSWKRPASAAETERRLAESRRAVALGQTPSDGEKERSDYGFVDSYEQTPTPTPRSNASSTPAGLMSSGMLGSGGESSAGVGGGKFNFDDGFESDFNQSSPPPAPAGTASSCNSTPAGPISGGSVASGGSKSLFRFSNDFSEKGGEKREHFEMDPPATSTPPITQKLRFDDNVKISQFDDAAFEDDFAKASFDFEKEQTSAGGGGATAAAGGSVALTRKQNMRTTKLQQRQELIKKSESVNIFAKKQEDPFEDDEFFKSPDQDQQKDNDGEAAATANNKFQWNENENFAKFDENM
ncbi:GL13284 [Drosophila persimilis]|uniref:GL13284 n=1 Tax=Drosophila persimilis TaxID=7234 RepID=B4H7C6_DROPE|nr:GL13284 [Drosophila persimilis]